MKLILLASASLLCAPSIWAAAYLEYPIRPLPEKIVTDSVESKPAANASKTFQLIGGIDGLTVQPDKSILSSRPRKSEYSPL